MKKVLAFASVGILSIGLLANQKTQGPETRTIMHSIFAAISELLPLSFDPEAFKMDGNKKKVGSALKALADHGTKLKAHGAMGENGFSYMSRTFSSDALQAYKWYQVGDFEGARFYVHNIVEDCVACHSKLKSVRNFPGVGSFFKEIDMKKLPLIEQARLQIALRQFDPALESYEKYFLNEVGNSLSSYHIDALSDYFKIAIRVKRDFNRPIKLLSNLNKKVEKSYMNRLLMAWKQSLEDLRKMNIYRKPTIETAQKLIKAGKERMSYGMDKVSLVYYTGASGVLLDYIERAAKSDAERAVAYYYLGVTETLLSHSFWVSESKVYFEASIRFDPIGKMAKKSYALLEEQAILEYSGSSGTHLPADVKGMLGELEKLIK